VYAIVAIIVIAFVGQRLQENVPLARMVAI
jgi:hypothetical protein